MTTLNDLRNARIDSYPRFVSGFDAIKKIDKCRFIVTLGSANQKGLSLSSSA
jgi:hypothetical protein